jgi:monoterpene epsilon-lactone hydrolase
VSHARTPHLPAVRNFPPRDRPGSGACPAALPRGTRPFLATPASPMALHWRLQLVDHAARWRFKRHAERPLDVAWVRRRLGRPLWARRLITPPILRARDTAAGCAIDMLRPPVREVPVVERTLLYVHGGGYFACSTDTHRPLAARLAREWRALAFVPEYRLAPEHPFPAARDDVLAVWEAMLARHGADPAHAVWAGDSAGGGLALSAALACAERGLPRPAAIVTFSPWVDLSCAGASLEENAERCAMFVPAQLRAAAALYASDHALVHPGVSPLFGDLRAMPPLCVHAGEDELLRDDAQRLAAAAAAAGVSVEARLWPGVPHVWQFLAGFLPEARESLDAARAFVERHVPASGLAVAPSTGPAR